MRLTTRDPVMRAVAFLLDEMERRLTRCDQQRIRCDLPGLQAEAQELAAVVAELGELCGVKPARADQEKRHDGTGKVQDRRTGRR